MLTGNDLKAAVDDALFAASELLKIGWCKTWARNKEGKGVAPQSEDACEWCLEGALIAATIHKYGETNPITGELQDTELARQVRTSATAMIQMANKPMAEQMAKSHKKIKAGQYLGATQIHPASVIPQHNDAYGSSQEQVISWVQKARKLVSLAKWN